VHPRFRHGAAAIRRYTVDDRSIGGAMQLRMIHSGRSRDSLVTPSDARTFDLMLQLRLQLVRCEPTSHFNVSGTHCNGNGILHDEFGTFHLLAWTPAEWNAFRSNVVPIISRYWDRKFELTPSRPWYQRRAGEAPVAARFTCSLSLQLVDTAGHAHHRYFIIKPQEATFRSFASSETRRGMFTDRDLSLRRRPRMTRVGTAVHSVTFYQSTILHEFGHTLGLHHVAGQGNHSAAYGTTLEQRHDVMGLGEHASERAARPWISQLRHHLRPAHGEAPLTFTARIVAPQIITYWDNDWVPPAAAAAGHAAP
jgi:hypothetical protein